MYTLKAYSEYFMEDSIMDGMYEVEYREESEWEVESALEAAEKLIELGLTEFSGTAFYSPDGSYVTDYATAERCSESATVDGFNVEGLRLIARLIDWSLS